MESWRALGRLPRRLWLLAAAALINRAGTMALPFLTLYLVRGLGWSPSRAGAMLALYGLVAIIVAPLAGRLCDRWGTNRMMTWTLLASGAAMLSFPFARSNGAVVAMIVLWAVPTEAFRPAGMAAVAESTPPEMRKQANALHRLAVNLGMSVGPALGGFLAAASYRWLWWGNAATSLAAAAFLARALPPPPASSEPGEAQPLLSLGALRDPALLAVLAASVPVSLVFFQHEGPMPLYLVRDLGLPETFYGLLFTVNTALIVALEIPLNHATSRWSHARTLTVGSILFAAGFGAYGLGSRPSHIVLATAVWTFGEMVLMPGLTAAVADLAPTRRQGEYMGLYLTSFSVAFMLGPWAGLWLLEHQGARVLWGVCFATGLLSAALFSRPGFSAERRPRA